MTVRRLGREAGYHFKLGDHEQERMLTTVEARRWELIVLFSIIFKISKTSHR